MTEFNTLSAAHDDAGAGRLCATPTRTAVRQARHRRNAWRNGSSKPIAHPAEQAAAGGQLERRGHAAALHQRQHAAGLVCRRQAGYDRDVPAKAIKNGLEIVRDYTDAQGQAARPDHAGRGDRRACEDPRDRRQGHGQYRDRRPAAGRLRSGQTCRRRPMPAPSARRRHDQRPRRAHHPRHRLDLDAALCRCARGPRGDLRHARRPMCRSSSIASRPATAGKFIVPPAYGESMYDRRVQARAPGGDDADGGATRATDGAGHDDDAARHSILFAEWHALLWRAGRTGWSALGLVLALLVGVRLWPHPPLQGWKPSSVAVYDERGQLAAAGAGQRRSLSPVGAAEGHVAAAGRCGAAARGPLVLVASGLQSLRPGARRLGDLCAPRQSARAAPRSPCSWRGCSGRSTRARRWARLEQVARAIAARTVLFQAQTSSRPISTTRLMAATSKARARRASPISTSRSAR